MTRSPKLPWLAQGALLGWVGTRLVVAPRDPVAWGALAIALFGALMLVRIELDARRRARASSSSCTSGSSRRQRGSSHERCRQPDRSTHRRIPA